MKSPTCLASGLLFCLAGLAALADRYWAEIDLVLVTGAVVAASGLAMVVFVVLRRNASRHR